jgi:hypothetical protein
VEELLSRLVIARLDGEKIYLMAYGNALVVERARYGYAVRSEGDDRVTRICADVDDVVAVVRMWRPQGGPE